MKKSNIYRLCLSVTKDLKRSMDKVAGQVNWSAVAAEAFEIKLAEIASAKDAPNWGRCSNASNVSKWRYPG